MSLYRLSFDIKGSEKLGIIIAALAKEGVTFHVSEPLNGQAPRQLHQSFRNPKNSRTAQIVFDNTAVGETLDAAKVRSVFESAGFAASSLSPTMSRLCQSGHFKRGANNSLERVR